MEVNESGSGSRSSIKLEPVYKAVNKESLLAGSYIRATRIENVGGSKQTSCTCKRWKAGEAYTRNKSNQRTELASSLSKNGVKKKINPTGPDGHIITCKSYGSFRHLLNACPDSWENMAKTNTWEYKHVKLSQGNREEKVESCQDGLKKLENKDELKEENCNSALIAELVSEIKSLKIETISLRDEIKKIKADRDRELERQSEKIEDCEQNLQQEKEKCNKALNQLRCELTEVRSSITAIQRQEETQRKL